VVWDCLIIGLLRLHNVQSLTNVTVATIVIGKVGKLVLPRASCFNLNLATLFLSTKQHADITARDVV
jgi:hypothetical protein